MLFYTLVKANDALNSFQILELGRWRSVCTNSRNWTQADMEVACRQLGFTGGEWYFWHLHLNDTVQMLYEEPGENL